MGYEEKLKSLGFEIPEAAEPVAAYIPGILEGGYIYTSGQLPSVNGKVITGTLGADCTEREGYEAARISALNNLAVVKSITGDLDKIERVVKVTGYVNSTPDFEAQPRIINGASELLGEVFGDAGKHTRCAVGVSSLPLGACCEIDMIFKVKE